jgi:hypothetical protein
MSPLEQFTPSRWTYFFVSVSAFAGVLLACLPAIFEKMTTDSSWVSIVLGLAWMAFSLRLLWTLRAHFVRVSGRRIEIGSPSGIRVLNREDIRSVGMYSGIIFMVPVAGEVITLPVIYDRHFTLFQLLKS